MYVGPARVALTTLLQRSFLTPPFVAWYRGTGPLPPSLSHLRVRIPVPLSPTSLSPRSAARAIVTQVSYLMYENKLNSKLTDLSSS